MSNERILLVSSFAPPHGGAATVMFAHGKHLAKLGYAITTLSMETGYEPLKSFGCTAVVMRGMRVAGDWLLGPFALHRLWRVIKKHNVVCLHSQFYLLNVWTALFAKLQQKRVVAIHHGYIRSETRNIQQTRLMNRLIDSWIILREEDLEWLKRRAQKRKPVVQISNGVEYGELTPLRREHNGRCARFVFCGGLIKDKGLAELLRVAQEEPSLHFAFVGDGEYFDAVSALPNTEMLGRLPHAEAVAAISTYDCLILPSYHEVMPMVLLEALALNVPVIMTDLSAQIRELVQDNGILITPKSYESLRDAVTKAATDGLRVANPKVIQKLDWEVLAPEIAQAITKKKS